MSVELETAALASAGALKSDGQGPGDGPAPACHNCGAPVYGRYCGVCGQLHDTLRRPLLTLILDSIKDAFSLDGRLARTIPSLMLQPGRVTREYLDGHRARYVPPFRLYLIASLVFFGVLFWTIDRNGWNEFKIDPDQAASVDTAVSIGENSAGADDFIEEDGRVNRQRIYDLIAGEDTMDDDDRQAARMIADQVIDAYENQTLLQVIMQTWAPRLALLLFPVFAVFLSLAYAWRRDVLLFEHVVGALHFQTFLYLMSAVLILSAPLIGGWAALVFFLAPPIFLYRMLRVVYGTGRFLSGLRTFVLLMLTTVTVTALVMALLVIGVSQVDV